MSSTVYVIPAAGLQVRDPRTAEPLPSTGAEVPRSGYWLRRLREGSVTEGRPPKAAKKTTQE
jgi:hypothetical protein